MSWNDPIGDLRTLLSDGATDKYRYRKMIFPAPDGVNVSFKTFEFRRITDFTNCLAPLGIYVNKIRQDVAASDDPATGEFSFVTPPQDGDLVECTYYIQWFNDTELETFLRAASGWLQLGDNFNNLDSGLIPSAKNYAAAEAYQKLALKWSERSSETFKVEDAMDPKTREAINSYMDLSKALRETATQLRNDYYERSGQPLAPNRGYALGRATNVIPKA